MASKARCEANSWLRRRAGEVRGRVLSIGSGDDQDGEGGCYRRYFASASAYVTSEVEPRPDCDLVLDVRDMPTIGAKSYDCVFCSGVLEHVDDYHAALREIRRVLKDGGLLLLGVPFRQPIHMPPNDYWRFTRHGVELLLESHGFGIAELIALDDSPSTSFPAAYWAKANKLPSTPGYEGDCRRPAKTASGLQGGLLQRGPAHVSAPGVGTLGLGREGTIGPLTGRVHIVIADDGWILERCAREIADRLANVTVSSTPDPSADVNYYVNYSAYRGPQPTIEVAFFTHIEERSPEARERFFQVAHAMDACVCMSDRYADALRQAGASDVQVITPGVDLLLYRPLVRVGVVGRTYHTGRKGEDLVRAVMDEPGIEWHFTGSGWPAPATFYSPEQMPDFYNSVDYILVPSHYEGGPMCVLEALACGKEVIAPNVGFVEDYPHIEYRTGDAQDLRRVLRGLVAQRDELRQAVVGRSWDNWASLHAGLFRQLLEGKSSSPALATAEPERLRVLMAMHAPGKAADGGPSIRLGKTKERLEELGLSVDITDEDLPDARGYDLVHVFNVWEPHSALAQLRHLKQFGIPIVFSPIYLDLSEMVWARRAVPTVFQTAQTPAELDRYLAVMGGGDLVVDGISRFQTHEVQPGFFWEVREMVGLADHIIALSEHEITRLWATGATPRPYSLVHNAADFSRFTQASAKPFYDRYGLRDYVLCVGRIERRKNQLMLVHALRDANVPIVLIGSTGEVDYAELVRRQAGDNVTFIDRLPHDGDLLASAYAGARVFVLPSWSEGAPLVALEAAAAGTALVLSDRSAEREYFGDLATYCDPASVESIHQTVLAAYAGASAEGEKRQARQELIRSKYTWENAARGTFAAYRSALAEFKRRAVAPTNVVRKLEIGSGDNPQPGYEHLDVRPDSPHVEHVHDITKSLPFMDGTFDEILSRSCLEHVSWRRAAAILRDWYRVLKPGGMLRIWLPDLAYLCRMYLDGKADEHLDQAYVTAANELLGGYTPAAWATIKMFGGQEYDR
ncbi:MAG: glycosyltransferase, partial [Dehalococcoidales bacterium]|nr:glycosyltransferase [Dehalococcoidales bacterium]